MCKEIRLCVPCMERKKAPELLLGKEKGKLESVRHSGAASLANLASIRTAEYP